ncbi:unnamed protein product, partial [Staurois parvus]
RFPHQSDPSHQLSPSKFPQLPPYIRFPHQSDPSHQVSPSKFPLTSECPLQSSPLTSGVPIRVPPYIRCPHQSSPLHQVSPSELPLTSGVPIRVPSYIRLSQSECPLTSTVRIRLAHGSVEFWGYTSKILWGTAHPSTPL